jgi:hypothetical protein
MRSLWLISAQRQVRRVRRLSAAVSSARIREVQLLLQCATTRTRHSCVDERLPSVDTERLLLHGTEAEAKEFLACIDILKAFCAILGFDMLAHVRVQARTHGLGARESRHIRG